MRFYEMPCHPQDSCDARGRDHLDGKQSQPQAERVGTEQASHRCISAMIARARER